MSEHGLVVSEIVSQLVAEARRQEGLSMVELADRAGVHPTYVGLLERRSRQPTIAAAASLAEALGLRLSELVAEAEQDAANGGSVPEVELLPAPPRRLADRAHLGACRRLVAATFLAGEELASAVDFAYRRLDLLDVQTRASAGRPVVTLLALDAVSALLRNLLAAGLARASGGLYVANVPDQSPALLPLRAGLPEVDVEVGLETAQPTAQPGWTGSFLAFRYVLAGRDGTFRRGKDERGDTVAVWEARFGELRDGDLAANGSGRLRRDALDRLELAYYDPALLPYAKATGEYARAG